MFFDVQNESNYEYMRVFTEKFRNFCDKSPLNLTFTLNYDRVNLLIVDPFGGTGKESHPLIRKEFELNLSVPPGDNIYQIKKELLSYYPMFSVVSNRAFVPMTADKMEKLRHSYGMSWEDIMGVDDIDVELKVFRLEKLFHYENNIFIRDLKNEDTHIYHFRYPVVAWFSDLVGGYQERAIRMFQDQAILYKSMASDGRVIFSAFAEKSGKEM